MLPYLRRRTERAADEDFDAEDSFTLAGFLAECDDERVVRVVRVCFFSFTVVVCTSVDVESLAAAAFSRLA
jgi:hypothetical protein